MLSHQDRVTPNLFDIFAILILEVLTPVHLILNSIDSGLQLIGIFGIIVLYSYILFVLYERIDRSGNCFLSCTAQSFLHSADLGYACRIWILLTNDRVRLRRASFTLDLR